MNISNSEVFENHAITNNINAADWLLWNNCADSLEIFVTTKWRSLYDDPNVIQTDGAQMPRWLTYGELEHACRQFDCQGKRFRAYSKVRSDRVKHTG